MAWNVSFGNVITIERASGGGSGAEYHSQNVALAKYHILFIVATIFFNNDMIFCEWVTGVNVIGLQRRHGVSGKL